RQAGGLDFVHIGGQPRRFSQLPRQCRLPRRPYFGFAPFLVLLLARRRYRAFACFLGTFTKKQADPYQRGYGDQENKNANAPQSPPEGEPSHGISDVVKSPHQQNADDHTSEDLYSLQAEESQGN